MPVDLLSEPFLRHLVLCDEYARRHDLGCWATRLVLVDKSYDRATAKRLAEDPPICAWTGCYNEPTGRSMYCSRECSNKNARWRHTLRKDGAFEPLNHPARCYERMVNIGLFSEEPEGVAWTPGSEPWESDPIGWLHEVIHIADGQEPPVGFPLMRPRRHLRLVS